MGINLIYWTKVVLFNKNYEIPSQKIREKTFSNLMMHCKINAA